MAGNYPDPPAPRMAWDRDGSALVSIVGGVATQLTVADKVILNNEADDTGALWPESGAAYLAVIFPELRDIVAVKVLLGGASSLGTAPCTIEASADSTNGLDGTWTAITASFSPVRSDVAPAYRTPMSAAASGVRAIRLNRAASITNQLLLSTFHIYGDIAAGQTLDRLALWHPTSDQRLPAAALDWGNAPRNSSADLTFRVKNMSSSKTASNVALTMGALTDTTPSTPAEHLLSLDGAVFANTVAIAALAPGAASGVITLRRVTPVDAQLGLVTFRLIASAATWA